MASKVRNLSALIDKQLPEFISAEYPKFSEFLQKYYEQLELPGQPLDLINNLFKYRDVDTYGKKILKESCTLTSDATETANIIYVDNTDSFPSLNGYLMIGDEVIFYQEKTNNSFIGCYRNVSGTTTIGDLYNSSLVKRVEYKDLGTGTYHVSSAEVFNVSNLFLYALVKNFESEYLSDFPQKDLRPSVDKRTLIKNIKKFYSAKGTDQSIRFLFNSIVTDDSTNIPTVYYPKDNTYKSSVGDWINKYSLKVKVISGDINQSIGRKIVQEIDPQDLNIKAAFSIVDNIIDIGDGFYEIVLGGGTTVGEFSIAAQTFLTKPLLFSSSSNSRINVYSTEGWDYTSGTIAIGNEIIEYKEKNVNQFTIENRGSIPITYPVNTPVTSNTTVSVNYTDTTGNTQTIKILILGILYQLSPEKLYPYSSKGDVIQISKSGFDTRDTIIYDNILQTKRWILNETHISPSSSNTSILTDISQCIADVSAIYEDDQYYYIASSGFPSHSIGKSSWNINLKDQKTLKLIRKFPSRTTEIYSTPINEIGILVNGVTIRSYKDEEQVVFGEITSIQVTKQGSGYVKPPKVLIYNAAREEVAQAYAVLAGEVVEKVEVVASGAGFFPPVPVIEITSGRNAVVQAVVTADKVTSLKIINPGEYYTSPPKIIVRDKLGQGRFASFRAVISTDGQLTGFIKEDEGKFYTQKNVEVIVESLGNGATADSIVRTWRKNKLEKYENDLDSSNGLYFLNNNIAAGYGYSYLADPLQLRNTLNDNGSSHSPLLGYAFDGNPIYGCYGYSDPLDSDSSIQKIRSSFVLRTSRPLGPSIIEYSLGSFIEDYQYNHRSGDLDENNGRFCVTPEYSKGTYAYFVTVDANNIPAFPYLIGQNYYSIPVDSNYNKTISQDDLPSKVSRLRTPLTFENGEGVFAYIDEVFSGTVSNTVVESTPPTFSCGSVVDVDYTDTNGSGIIAKVSKIKGKPVDSVESQQTKAVKITTENSAYFFKGATITQTQSNSVATGELIGDVFDDKTLVLRNTQGKFNLTNTLSSATLVINIITNTPGTFTGGKEVILTTGRQLIIIKVENNALFVAANTFKNNEPVTFTASFGGVVKDQLYYIVQGAATYFYISNNPGGAVVTITNTASVGAVVTSERGRGLILESSDFKNTLKIKVLQGTFDASQNTGDAEAVENDYFLRSFSDADSVGAKVNTIFNLSSGIKPFKIFDNIAIVKTTQNHGVSLNDRVFVDINPNDTTTETTIYVRKRIYQKIILSTPVFIKRIKDTGIGRLSLLNSGTDYASTTSGNQTFNDVELIFANQSLCRDEEGRIVGNSSRAVIGKAGALNNAKATIIVSDGKVTSITITDKGEGYQRGDILTVNATTLLRSTTTTSTVFFLSEVKHVGFGSNETKLFLDSVLLVSQNDFIAIGEEILKVTSVSQNESSVTVLRAQKNTISIDHFNNQEVLSYEETFRFGANYQVGFGDSEGIIDSYDAKTQTLTLFYTLGKDLNQITPVFAGKTFFDESTPPKLITVKDNIEVASYKFEFSFDNSIFERNPNIEIQKYYKYKFDTSNPTLFGSFLDFSPSGNFNIIAEEVTRSTAVPGTVGSYTDIKLGFGAAIDSNNYTEKIPVDFTNYFYYDKNGIIDSDKSYLRLIPDPLQGEKIVTYVTPTQFVYNMEISVPKYDGTGSISYSTNSTLATGQVDKIDIFNQGKELIQIPTIYGIRPSKENECIVDVNWNEDAENIISAFIVFPGKNYSIPKVVVLSSSGVGAKFSILKNSDGTISSIVTTDKGSGYKTKPDVKIVESDVKCYFESQNIGLVKNVGLTVNGKNFSKDNTIFKQFTGSQILLLKNISPGSTFISGEKVEQYDGNSTSFGFVLGYKENTNILKLEKVEGEFKSGLQINGKLGNKTAIVVDSFSSVFKSEIKSYYDNLGYYLSDKSKLSSASQKLADSYLHQDYSYVVKSKTPINQWRDLVTDTVHPSGFKLFGEVAIESFGEAKINPIQQKQDRISIIQLWDPEKNKITVQNTYRTITQSTIRLKNSNEIRGRGGVFSPAYDTGETVAYEFYLTPNFNGIINQNGNNEGNTVFTIKLRGSNNIFSVDNQNNVLLTLDGVLQEPGISYNIVGSQITFTQPPLGYRNLFGETISQAQYKEGVDSPAQKLVGRIIKFKDQTLNNKYFRKIKNIAPQFNGLNKEFELYYEDNTPVSLEDNENLLVAIDGVLQNAGATPLLPGDRAYYIRRTVTPNKLVFLEAPKVYEIFSQKFFGITVGSFERIGIDLRFVDGTFKGPFLMRSLVSGKSIGVDDDRNVLVFLEGVLQRRNRDYVLRGSTITFSESISVGQQVNIIYLYGRDFFKSLTAFNYERVQYINRFQIVVQGAILGNVSDGVTIYSASANGTVRVKYFDGVNTTITVDSQNTRFTTDEDLNFKSTSGTTFVIPSQQIVEIKPFEEDSDTGDDILVKSVPGWLVGYEETAARQNNFINIGDLIKVDGEDEFRTIQSISTTGRKTNYRDQDDVNEGYYGKLGTSNYSGIARGEGLSIISVIENGKVVSLLWNQKTWDNYVVTKIYPQPPGYGYETAPQLYFIPQSLRDEGGTITAPPTGGGAKAYVVVSNGEVIDVVLYDQGSGYLTEPKVVVARGYDLIRKDKSFQISQVLIGCVPKLDSTSFNVTSGSAISGIDDAFIILQRSFSVTFADRNIVITAIIHPYAAAGESLKIAEYQHTTTFNIGTLDVSSLSIAHRVLQTEIAPRAAIVSQNNITVNSVQEEFLSVIRTFSKINSLLAYRSLSETGAYLDSFMTPASTTAFVPSTTKFLATGKLLIEDEVVSYNSKLSDRFIGLVRGADGTTAKEHLPGAFLRQYREDVTIIEAGVQRDVEVIITSESSSVSMSSTTHVWLISQLQKIINPDIVTVQNHLITTITQNKQEVGIISIVNAGVKPDVEVIVTTSSSFVSMSSTAHRLLISQLQKIINVDIVAVENHLITTITQNKQEVGIISIVNAGVKPDVEVIVTTSSSSVSMSSTAHVWSISQLQKIINVDIVAVENHLITTTTQKKEQVGIISIVNAGVKPDVEVIVTTSSSSVSMSSTAHRLLISQLQKIINPDIVTVEKEITTIRQQTSEVAVVSIVDAGVKPEVTTEIRSDISLIPIVSTVENARISSSYEIVRTIDSVSSVSPEIKLTFPSGFIDYYVENIIVTNPIDTRSGSVTLFDSINEITFRDGSTIVVANRDSSMLISGYQLGNVGTNINQYNDWVFNSAGSDSVSELTFAELELLFAGFTLADFALPDDSQTQYSISGKVWNYTMPSIQEYGAVLTAEINNTSISISVADTTKFPSSGKLLINREVVSYSGKTTTTFTGLTRGVGNTSISIHAVGDYLRTSS